MTLHTLVSKWCQQSCFETCFALSTFQHLQVLGAKHVSNPGSVIKQSNPVPCMIDAAGSNNATEVWAKPLGNQRTAAFVLNTAVHNNSHGPNTRNTGGPVAMVTCNASRPSQDWLLGPGIPLLLRPLPPTAPCRFHSLGSLVPWFLGSFVPWVPCFPWAR